MRLRKAIVFILCAVLTLPLMACSKSTRGGYGKTCTITFKVGAAAEAAGAVVTPEKLEVKSGKTCGTLPVPTGYADHTFTGWFAVTGKQLLETTVIKDDMTVTAKWISREEQDNAAKEYEESLTQANGWEAGHLYIHYKRYSHAVSEEGRTNSGAPDYSGAIDSEVYKDWGLWLWPKNDDGRLFNAKKIDQSGAVYDILIDHTYTDAGWDGENKVPMQNSITYKDASSIGMQLFQISTRTGTGFWANDGGNNYLYFEDMIRDDGTYHWFVSQGNVGYGTPKYSAEEISDPYEGIPQGSAITKTTVGDGIINSAVDNRATYPTWGQKAAGYDEAGVGYQIFIASFADSDGDGMGDLRGIINKLDYLESLNVDVLWLTPFQTSTNYHGYDIKDYYSVDSRFGTLSDYRELVYKVHKKGMKIVMDFVLNHTSQSNPWFVKSQNLVKETGANGETIDYRNFYTWINGDQYAALSESEKTQWFGDAYGYYFYSSFSSDMPELNYDYQPVRDAILEVCNYWMAFGLDGFRLDAVKHIYMKNELVGKTPSTGNIDNGEGTVEDGLYSYDLMRNLNFYREFNYRLKSNYPNAFLVGENLDGNPRNTTNYLQGIDSQFNFNLYYDATRAIAAAQQYSSDPGRATKLVSQYISGYYGNSYTSGNGENVNVKGYATVNPNFIDGLFTSNHDLPRARDRMNITTDSTQQSDTYHALTAQEAEKTDKLLRMYYAYIMTVPGLNWIYYGDELGMTGVMQSTIDSGSTSTTESEPHEDRIYRQPMKWYTETSRNASFDIGYGTLKAELTGLNATDAVQGADSQDTDQNSLLNWMRTLTRVRNDNPVLINGVMEKTTNFISGSTVMYTISKGAEKVKVYLNFGDNAFNVNESNVLASYGMSGKTLNKYGVAIVKA